jgi:hypothetical protein
MDDAMEMDEAEFAIYNERMRCLFMDEGHIKHRGEAILRALLTPIDQLELDTQRKELDKRRKEIDPTPAEPIVPSPAAPSEPTPLIPAPEPEPVNTHRVTDRLIQQYDATDLTRLIATHAGIREAARAVPGSKGHGVALACADNREYNGFRWFAIERDEPQHARTIPPTEQPKYHTGAIAQLDLERTRIIAVYADQKNATEAMGLRNSSSITLAIKKNTTANGFSWMNLSNCSEELRDTFDGEVIGSATQRGRSVLQLDTITGAVIKKFPSMADACTALQGSHKMFKEACSFGVEYKNCRWRWA